VVPSKATRGQNYRARRRGRRLKKTSKGGPGCTSDEKEKMDRGARAMIRVGEERRRRSSRRKSHKSFTPRGEQRGHTSGQCARGNRGTSNAPQEPVSEGTKGLPPKRKRQQPSEGGGVKNARANVTATGETSKKSARRRTRMGEI